MADITDKEREMIEDTIMDVHFAAQKYIENEKEIHRKLLELNIQDALDVFTELKDKLVDDEMKNDYILHLFIPFQIYELIKMRDDRKEN